MRTVQTSFLAGAAMIVFAGFAQAQAQSPGTHVLTIHLPGGGVERIQYSGDVPPEIFFGPNPVLAELPVAFPAFGPGSPFAALDRMSEEMDRRAALLLREAAAMADHIPTEPGQLIQAQSRSLPPSGQSYHFVSAMSANGVCGRSVEITSFGDGKEPRVVSRSFGHCGTARPATARGSLPKPPKPAHLPDMVNTQSRSPAEATHAGLVQEAAWQP